MKGRTLILPLDGSATAVVPCLEGKQIRIAAVSYALTGVNDGDQAEVRMSMDGQLVARACTGPLSAAMADACAFITASETTMQAANIAMTSVNHPLPDLWFSRPITVTPTAIGGLSVTASAGLVLYEERDAL